jgi:hypothetical protein
MRVASVNAATASGHRFSSTSSRPSEKYPIGDSGNSCTICRNMASRDSPIS